VNTDSYRPPRWLRNRHLQLAWGVIRARPRLELRRESVETADGDVVLLDHVDSGPPPRPRLLVLHGLEGSSFSPTSHGLLALAARRGWNATALNFRSCARDLRRPVRRIDNRTARLYHSGETGDVDASSRSFEPNPACGPPPHGSIGGNVLPSGWEEPGLDADHRRRRAFDSHDPLACARHLETQVPYTAFFLRSFRTKAVSCRDDSRKRPSGSMRRAAGRGPSISMMPPPPPRVRGAADYAVELAPVPPR
jgi:predicted alpha/beta-fold hydrolase